MNRHNVLTEEEINKIRTLHAQGLNGKEIAEKLGISRATVSNRLRKMGLKNNSPPPLFTDGEKEIIFSRYIAGETIREIAVDFPKQGPDRVNRILRNADLTRRNGAQVHFDESYFENIDDEYKAYFLGLLFTDGNIRYYDGTSGKYHRKGWTIQINLNEKEGGDILRELKRRMHDERPLRVYSRPGTGGKYIRHSATVSFGSEKLYNDLVKWGMTENKLEQPRLLPPLRPDLIHHFIRGCFDGDGSVFYSNGKKHKHVGANICGNKVFLEQINEIFNEVVKTPLSKSRKVFDRGRFGSIHFGTTKTCEKLFEYLYEDAHIYMEIKYNKFVEYLKRR